MTSKLTIAAIVLMAVVSATCASKDKPAASASGASAASGSVSAGKSDYEKAIKAAMEAEKKAASVDSEWRDTGELISQAEEAAAKGDYAAATRLANKAKMQGMNGYEQGMGQKDAGPRF